MIVDGILLILQGIVNVLLAPLEVINIGVDLVAGIPIISDFMNVIFYVLPMNNLMPLITLIVSLFMFRAVIALIQTIWNLLPIL